MTDKTWQEKHRCEWELEYTNKLNRLLVKQADSLAEALRFYANSDYFSEDWGELARRTLEEWYDL